MSSARIGKEDIRHELRKLVQRDRDSVLEKWEKSKDELRSEAPRLDPSEQSAVPGILRDFDQKDVEIDLIYDELFRVIDEA